MDPQPTRFILDGVKAGCSHSRGDSDDNGMNVAWPASHSLTDYLTELRRSDPAPPLRLYPPLALCARIGIALYCANVRPAIGPQPPESIDADPFAASPANELADEVLEYAWVQIVKPKRRTGRVAHGTECRSQPGVAD